MNDDRWNTIYLLSDRIIKDVNGMRAMLTPGDAVLALAIAMAEIVRASSISWDVVDKAIAIVKRDSAQKLNS